MEGEIHIDNAGLVLLNPFLPGLAKQLDSGDGNILPRMVQLMQYMAGGDESISGKDLSLNKLLVGIEMTDALSIPHPLTEAEKEECDHLLTSFISYWKALKGISIEGLRNEFLLRRGIIMVKDAKLELFVEKRGIDILLEHIPWNFSMIMNPWMKQLLYVNWL